MAFSGTLFGVKKSAIYDALKYSIYLLLLLNLFYFTFEDYMSAGHRFRDGIEWSQFTAAFAQAVDSFAWLVLLLMLELETWVIDDNNYHGVVKWSINGVSGVCYVLIFFAFLGYTEKLNFVLQFEESNITQACDAIGTYLSYAIDIDEFAALTMQTCSSIGSAPYWVNVQSNIIASNAIHSDMTVLGYTEVINAGAWLLVVILLWIDVYMQMGRIQAKQYHTISARIKVVLYSILIGAAILWGFYGEFIDFWDAFLWIVAFFFIEMNIFQWHEEINVVTPATATSTNAADTNQ
ncbi:hypothetical protein [Kordiimonas aquimaris]|uniref:hypothetical protein n=1 Tax=Kordiimonas aquimaris TaxID=707591 RepID=UPI0021D11A02|nr:hypothetical protein [Kordiimonas aquimaris]